MLLFARGINMIFDVDLYWSGERDFFWRVSLVLVAQKMLKEYFDYGYELGVEGFAEISAKNFTNFLGLRDQIVEMFITLFLAAKKRMAAGEIPEDVQVRIRVLGL